MPFLAVYSNIIIINACECCINYNYIIYNYNLNAMNIHHFDTYLDYVCVLIIQGFHNLFAYGCPDGEREFILFYFILFYFILFSFATRAGSPQQREPITVGSYYLTHPVNFPCGRKPEYPEKTHDFRQSVDYTLHMRTGFESTLR